MATGPDQKNIGKRAREIKKRLEQIEREIKKRLEQIERQIDGEASATGMTNAAGQSDQAFEYNPDCPACLRSRQHTRAEHEQALARVAQASDPNAPDDEG